MLLPFLRSLRVYFQSRADLQTEILALRLPSRGAATADSEAETESCPSPKFHQSES
jgi:hypothetical protein